jgi:hypothetical protein
MQLLDMGEGAAVAKLREVEGRGAGRRETMAETDTRKGAFRSSSLSNHYNFPCDGSEKQMELTLSQSEI